MNVTEFQYVAESRDAMAVGSIPILDINFFSFPRSDRQSVAESTTQRNASKNRRKVENIMHSNLNLWE